MPAAVIAGRLLARRNDLRKAAKIIEAAWKATPHPELAKVYLNLRTGDSARDRLARAENLAKLSSWEPESRLVIAQAATEAKDFGRAREALTPLTDDRPTARVCRMMARIEAAEHGAESGRSREWLARAARAPRDPAWVADGIISERWAPVSPVSGRLDAFVWKTPPEILAGPEDDDAPAPAPAEPAAPVAIPAAPVPAPVTTDSPAPSTPGFLQTGAGTPSVPPTPAPVNGPTGPSSATQAAAADRPRRIA
ncbi:UNVERIFIED_ORG: putative membrane-anchored protein [Methylorubrum zatmanii]|nr:putative membrane-anchored protein [Methylorubrum zatmanii]